jgi:hypothetical protein
MQYVRKPVSLSFVIFGVNLAQIGLSRPYTSDYISWKPVSDLDNTLYV